MAIQAAGLGQCPGRFRPAAQMQMNIAVQGPVDEIPLGRPVLPGTRTDPVDGAHRIGDGKLAHQNCGKIASECTIISTYLHVDVPTAVSSSLLQRTIFYILSP